MQPLILLLGPTASGKTALAIALAQCFGAEILSCDSVAVYRYMQLGTAKPSPEQRALIPHHLLDLYDPTEPCTAGDYARQARTVLANLATRNTLPILAGGTGLYARALLDGLFPSPPTNPALRTLLRNRDPSRLHRTLTRFDPAAAALIHPHDTPKLIRAIEVSLAARRPITQQWQAGRNALTGYSILRLTLAPPRPELYTRIDQRAAAMFTSGLIKETRTLIARFGPDCRPFTSLGYAQAAAILRNELTEAEAIAATQQGHRNYSKRQQTWFRREAALHLTHTLAGFGDAPAILAQATGYIAAHLADTSPLKLSLMDPAPLFPHLADPRLPQIHQTLLDYYGKPPARDLWDPLTQFIYSLLSSRTKTKTSHQVMHNLRARFGTWENLRDAPVEDIERAIRIVTFPETKAPWLKQALQQITVRCGSLTLEFLAKYRTQKIRQWLEQFEGVGPKTSAAVVNFSTLRRRALCIDSHHLRVAQRLALTPRADAAITEQRLMRLVPPDWDAAMLDEHHSLIKLHGQTLCTFANPQCSVCPLLPTCPHGQKETSR